MNGIESGMSRGADGFHVLPEYDRTPPYDPDKKEHLWVVPALFRVHPDKWEPDSVGILDNENFLTIIPPGCWHCGQPYEDEAAARPCPGGAEEGDQ